jgi:hypothetical protein
MNQSFFYDTAYYFSTEKILAKYLHLTILYPYTNKKGGELYAKVHVFAPHPETRPMATASWSQGTLKNRQRIHRRNQ